MTINALDDMTQLKLAAGAFFEKLNQTVLPERFNWSSEIYEGLHVAERRGQDFYGQTESTSMIDNPPWKRINRTRQQRRTNIFIISFRN